MSFSMIYNIHYSKALGYAVYQDPLQVNERRGTCVKIVKRVSNIDSTSQSHLSTSNFSIAIANM